MSTHGELERLVMVLADRIAAGVAERLPAAPQVTAEDSRPSEALAVELATHLVPAILPLLADALAEQQAAASADRSLLSAQGVADRLGVSERTARQMLADRQIPSLRVGGSRRVEPHEVEAYVEARRRAEDATG
jgi:excisionase family DNA binding protein